MDMNVILYSVVLLGVMGLLFGFILAIASQVFKVDSDERLEPLTEALPGANCGGCGYAGCGAYAAAVIAGTAPIGACPVGGAAVTAKMAEIMGVEAGDTTRKVAQVFCTGGGKEKLQYGYVGIHDCEAAVRLPGGTPMLCSFGCLGMGTCVKYCQFDALSIVDGVAKVDREKCVGCGACVKACPKHVIGMVDYDAYIEIPCSSKAPGKEVTKSCTNGCIGCNLCAKNCEAGAITVTDFLATVDNAKCTGCGTCVAKCPRKLISLVNGTAAVEAPQAAGAES